MRTQMTIFLLVMMMGCASSQNANRNFTSFYTKYQDDDGVKSFEIPCFLAKKILGDDDKDSDNLIKKINKLRFFLVENDQGNYGRKIQSYLPNADYHDLMIVREDGSTVIFKIKELKNGDIKEIVMTVTQPDSFLAISFTGNFTREDVHKMSKSIHTNDFDNFED
jgi:hypothetical protein